MKPGSLFMIGSPPSLYCECVKVFEGGEIQGNVINGAWGFHLASRYGVMKFDTPSGASVLKDQFISYEGPWPKTIDRWDYNAMIDFVAQQQLKPKPVRWFSWQRYKLNEFWMRLKRGVNALRTSRNKDLMDEEEDIFNDDIPF